MSSWLILICLCVSVALGRNQPLKREKPKWKSDYPMTDGQLRSKRDEFWDTAPAFEGRKEIWDALKAAAQAFESNDHELAQAIIDGASITLPHGKRPSTQIQISQCSLIQTRRLSRSYLFELSGLDILTRIYITFMHLSHTFI